jgi:hypothetical protein
MSQVVSAYVETPSRGRLARLVGVSPLTTEARLSYRAALGELIVGDLLENLGTQWDVLHDLPLGDGLLDHLAIGPAGVFSVRAVASNAAEVVVDGHTLTVAGDQLDDLRWAIDEANTVARLLSGDGDSGVQVVPLVVMINPRRIVVRAPAIGVRVVASRDLERLLTGAATVLRGDEVARISDRADLQSTWPPVQRADLDAQQLHRDFGKIRAEVGDARNRRVIWGVLSVVVAYGFLWSTVAGLVGVLLNA